LRPVLPICAAARTRWPCASSRRGGRDPHAGDLYVFRGKSGKLIKIFWHDGLGASLYAKRLENGRFVWPSTKNGLVVITPGQLGYLLEGIDWRHPQHTWRPEAAG
jgi:transposase